MRNSFLVGLLAIMFVLPVAGNAVSKESNFVSVRDAEYDLVQYLLRPEKEKNLIVELNFKPSSGWKWNSKFPSQFSVKQVNKDVPYHIINEYVEMSGGAVKIYFHLKPSGQTYPSFALNGVFSFCNEDACKVYKRSFVFPLAGDSTPSTKLSK